MITVGTNRKMQSPFYNAADFLCDYESDVANLPTNRGAGSKAYVIENGNRYILNNQHQWVLQPASSSGGSGSGSTPGEGDIVVLGESSASGDDIIIL